MVMMDGQSCAWAGARSIRRQDLLGLVVGSEGLLGVVTEVTVRILPKPRAPRPP